MKRKVKQISPEIILFLDYIRYPENIAGIFRVADAMSVSKIFIYTNEEIKLSKGFNSIARVNTDKVPFQVVSKDEFHKEIEFLKEKGYSVFALEYTDKSKELISIPKLEKIVLIAGDEKYGVHEDTLRQIDDAFHIPMNGTISSLNINQAVSISLWEIRRGNSIDGFS